MRKLRLTLSLFILLLLATAGEVVAQRAEPRAARAGAVSYLFVSPNTREGLSRAEALAKLNSAEEVGLIVGARGLTQCLGLEAVITKALGSWADGAEHMALIKTTADEATVRYLDARLGLSARQKSVLYFRVHGGGAAKMYALTLRPGRRHLTAVARALDISGVAHRTLIPGRRRTTVLVIDLNDQLGARVAAAARLLGGSYRVMSGTGAFIGDGESRERARQVYREVVEGYESAGGRDADTCGSERRGARAGARRSSPTARH